MFCDGVNKDDRFSPHMMIGVQSNGGVGGSVKIAKSKFKPEEDKLLMKLVSEYGKKDWKKISKLMGTRNSRQCRERWRNYLRPEVIQANWTEAEDSLLLQRYNELGPKWNIIGLCFNGRSVNNIRNRWVKLMRRKANPGLSEEVSRVDSTEPEIPLQQCQDLERLSEIDLFSTSRDDWENIMYSSYFNE